MPLHASSTPSDLALGAFAGQEPTQQQEHMSDEPGIDSVALDPPFSQSLLICEACGRSFEQVNAYSNHIGSCRLQKKRMASALGAAKEKYRNKKARLNTTLAQPLDSLASSSQLDTAPVNIIEVSNLVLSIYISLPY